MIKVLEAYNGKTGCFRCYGKVTDFMATISESNSRRVFDIIYGETVMEVEDFKGLDLILKTKLGTS